MSIRQATTNDAEHIRSLVASLSHFYLEDKEALLPEWLAATLTIDEFVKRINSEEYSCFIYENNGNIVGYIAIKGANHVYHLFVADGYQGKGIARALWQHAMHSCVSDHYTVRSSLFAVPVYIKFGFKESGPIAEKDGMWFQPMEYHR